MRYGPQCSHTRRNYHVFNKDTHRCGCGRWQAGFKPKEEPKETHECQICCRKQCVKANGTLVNHGYQRPGDGYIHGNCFGVGYLPYKDTKGLVAYVAWLKDQIEFHKQRLANTKNAQDLTYTIGYKQSTEHVTILKGDESRRYKGYWLPKFEEVREQKVREIERVLAAIKAEISRCETRITEAGNANVA